MGNKGSARKREAEHWRKGDQKDRQGEERGRAGLLDHREVLAHRLSRPRQAPASPEARVIENTGADVLKAAAPGNQPAMDLMPSPPRQKPKS